MLMKGHDTMGERLVKWLGLQYSSSTDACKINQRKEALQIYNVRHHSSYEANMHMCWPSCFFFSLANKELGEANIYKEKKSARHK
jgi:hypothetical protein